MNTALELVSNNTQNTEVNTMTSLEIAELTNKTHTNVMRDIRKMLEQLYSANSEIVSQFSDTYQGTRRQEKCYKIPSFVQDILMQKYEYKHMALGSREHGALCTIEQLNSIKLIRQYKVGNYRIDGYCKETNTAYEIDEEQHYTLTNRVKDAERQKYIEDKLGCTFVRINVSYKKVK